MPEKKSPAGREAQPPASEQAQERTSMRAAEKPDMWVPAAMEELADRVLLLPLKAQLALLRTLSARIIDELPEEERGGFIRELSEALQHGEPGAAAVEREPHPTLH